MMLVVISNPVALTGETEIINQLFAVGLAVLHLRKPDYSVEQLNGFLQQIDKRFYERIALHQHHQLADDFGLKRLHFTGKARKGTVESHLKNLCKKGFILSTSTHSPEEFTQLEPVFTYAFYGPVFNSISKPGYIGTQNIAPENSNIKCLAIGGIEKNTVKKASVLGYDGAAALGAIWQNENPVQEYKTLHQLWITANPSYSA